jgi:predicted GNAT superfamily acetyltransferase
MNTIHNFAALDPAITLTLNNAHAKETSALDLAGLKTLLAMAWYAKGIGHGAAAFLIALDQDADYDNPNFAWFKERYESFLYIDRIVVAASGRGQGLATLLYEDLFAAAKRAGQSRVVCEINLDPPNPASDAFHAVMGFAEVGQATIHSGAKTVRYLEKILISA